MNNERKIIDSVETLESALASLKEAEKKFSTYTQEQVDKIFLAAASAANKARIPLAKMAVEETGMGVVEDKVIKNNYAAEYIYNAYKNTKTCGIIEEDKAYGIKKIAEPVGVIAAVIPTTNPTSTAIFKCLLALKTRNAIIISPHPRAKKSTAAAAKVVLDAAVKAGAPEGIIEWIDTPSLEMTNLVMKESDIILATGGPGMVKAAYSSGKPAVGVGAGNTPAIIDDTADIVLAVNSIIHSKTFDNGMICASEQSVIVHQNVYDAVKTEFAARGCYFLDPEETEKVRKTILINGALNAKIVGQSAFRIAELAGVTVPEGTKILIGEVESVDLSVSFVDGQHRVYVKDVSNGSLTANVNWAAEGDKVYVTAKPSKGYELTWLSVKAADGTVLKIYEALGENTYYFYMPDQYVTVSGIFSLISSGLPFVDVNSGAWYYDAVSFVYNKGIMNGVTSTTFEPNSTITRGMVVTMLWRMAGEPYVSGGSFSDVASGRYYSTAVAWAAKNGIVDGYSSTVFGVNDPVTREQFATILYRYAKYMGYSTTGSSLYGYDDANKVSSWAKDAMGWAVRNGVIGGVTNTTLCPNNTATRAEVAQMFMNFYDFAN